MNKHVVIGRLICRWLFFVFMISLAACSSQTQKGVAETAVTPLSDLNLIRKKIPSVLLESQKDPYAIPLNQSCTALDRSIHALDAVLKPDIDVTKSEGDSDLIEQGSSEAEKNAVDTLRLTAEGMVPFRGWVRKLSGSERHANQVSAAINAGILRRAFLKGIRATKECDIDKLGPELSQPRIPDLRRK